MEQKEEQEIQECENCKSLKCKIKYYEYAIESQNKFMDESKKLFRSMEENFLSKKQYMEIEKNKLNYQIYCKDKELEDFKKQYDELKKIIFEMCSGQKK